MFTQLQMSIQASQLPTILWYLYMPIDFTSMTENSIFLCLIQFDDLNDLIQSLTRKVFYYSDNKVNCKRFCLKSHRGRFYKSLRHRRLQSFFLGRHLIIFRGENWPLYLCSQFLRAFWCAFFKAEVAVRWFYASRPIFAMHQLAETKYLNKCGRTRTKTSFNLQSLQKNWISIYPTTVDFLLHKYS